MSYPFRCVRAVALAAVLAVPITARADAPFRMFHIDPHGRVAGLILSDGTEVPASPRASADLARWIHSGDSIQLTYGPRGESLLSLRRAGRMFDLGPANTPVGITPGDVSVPTARGGGPRSLEAVPYAVVDDARPLARLTTQGHVTMLTHTSQGVPTGFVLDNGTQVSLVPSVAGVLADVHPGELLQIEGRGTSTPQGTGLWATSITTADRGVILDMYRGPGPVELRLNHGG